MTARFNFMHFMPYVHLPENHKDYASLWVDFPNKFYDPHKAAKLYDRYLDELVFADKIGFDAIVVNEHHNTSYSMMPAPSLIASARSSRTSSAAMDPRRSSPRPSRASGSTRSSRRSWSGCHHRPLIPEGPSGGSSSTPGSTSTGAW